MFSEIEKIYCRVEILEKTKEEEVCGKSDCKILQTKHAISDNIVIN